MHSHRYIPGQTYQVIIYESKEAVVIELMRYIVVAPSLLPWGVCWLSKCIFHPI